MRWLFCAIVCWAVLALVIDRRRLRGTWLTGAVASFSQISVDTVAIHSGLYRINEPGISIFGSSIFFFLGVVFPMGILLAQTTSQHIGKQVANIAAWTLMFTLFEWFVRHFHLMEHTNWNMLMSLNINILVMIMLTWITEHWGFYLEGRTHKR